MFATRECMAIDYRCAVKRAVGRWRRDYLWFPEKVDGRWHWLRWVERRRVFTPLDRPPAPPNRFTKRHHYTPNYFLRISVETRLAL